LRDSFGAREPAHLFLHGERSSALLTTPYEQRFKHHLQFDE